MAKTSINYDKLVAAKTSLKSIKIAIKRSDFFAGNFNKKETVIKNNLLKYDLISVLRKKCVYRISPDILHGSGGIGVFDDHTLLDIEGSSNNSLDFVNETESSREDNGYLITYINAPVKEYWSKISEECDSQSDFNLAPLVDDKPYNKLNSCLKEYTENVNKVYSSYANIKSALNVVCDDIDKAIRKINKIINAYMSLEKQSKKKFGDRSATRVQKQLTTLLKSGVSAKKIKSIAKELGYNVIISGKTVSIIRRRANSSKNTNATQGKKTKSKLSAAATLKKDLKKALKEGKKKKAFSIYKSLVSVIGADKAKKYLNNLGYKVGKSDDGSKVIKKIKPKDDSKNNDNSSKDSDDGSDSKDSDDSENSNDSEQPDNSDESENNNDSDDPDEPDEPINDDSNNSNEPINGDQSNGQPTNDSVATPSDDNASASANTSTSTSTYDSSNDSSSSGASYNYSSDVDSGSGNDSSGDGLIFDDSTSDEGVTDVDASKLVPSDSGDDSIIDDSVVSTPTKRVKTLEDDSTTSSSKSSGKSGLSAAVPLGLGVVATGAAAVAGARYIKHRKDSSYEDENYDDENNNLDEGNDYSYTDNSSNYDDSYMSDDYLGPAGSSYTDTNLDETSDDSDNVSDSYIDSDEYEDDSNDEDDLVLKDLN